MKKLVVVAIVLASLSALAQDKKPPTLRSILLEGLKTSHNEKDWFAPISSAVDGVTPAQANWKDTAGNHSIGQLTYHLLFWNGRELAKFKAEPQSKFSGNNDETFDNFDSKNWPATVKQLDDVMMALEKFVETADDATLNKYASDLAHVAAHNAYHTGQIIYIRKLQGSWDPEKGVK